MPQHFLKFALVLSSFCFNTALIAAEVGNPMPACLVSTLGETKTEDLQKYKGQVLYVDFWASWCIPCAHSFPFLNELHEQFKDKGLQIVGINMDENVDDAKAFLAKFPARFTVVADATQQCAKDFDVKAMPSSYIVDKKGLIHYVHLGFRPGETEELRALVASLLAEK
jgi:thiol-disulfide isomerase/thioredoxin